MAIRGIRGANEVAANTEEAILTATRDLLIAMQQANGFSARDIVSAVFTLTPDLNAAFPARAARELLGWVEVPLLCASEIDVPGAPGHLVRVLLHVDSEGGGAARSVYLGSAKALRPDHDDRPATPEMGEQRSVQRMRRQDVEGHGEGRGPVVAIDGPAGAGKSTVARAVARRLGCLYLDSGAMYRALALAALRAGVELGDGPALERLAARVDITLQPGADGSRVLLGGEDVTDAVRAPDVEEVVPRVAGIPGVRAVMI
ncbi:MAG TPA: chorismate mutase, partial [Bacillota bacterium]|nr:chorismate mutase [Bacillota bacterium]